MLVNAAPIHGYQDCHFDNFGKFNCHALAIFSVATKLAISANPVTIIAMNTLQTFAGMLKTAARGRGINFSDLSSRAGLSRMTLRKVLSGQEDYRVSTLLALADKLGLDVVLVPKAAARGIAAPTAERALVPSIVDEVLDSTPLIDNSSSTNNTNTSNTSKVRR